MTNHPDSKGPTEAGSQKASPKRYKKENLGGAIAEPTGFGSYSQPEGFFRNHLEPALRKAVAADDHAIILTPTEAKDRDVFAYLRGSTENQEGSIYTQAEDLVQACMREGFRLVQVFWDLESGTKGADERPGLKALKDAALQAKASPNRPAGVIVWHMNRFSRRIRIGLQDLWELSDAGCPVIFPRRGRGRLQQANMEISDDVVDAVLALADAADDLDEHVTKIRRGLRSLLRKGIHPTAKSDWLYWIRKPSTDKTKRGKPHMEVVRNPLPLIPYRTVASVLTAFPDFGTAQALARALGCSTGDLLDELQLRWAIGDFRFGAALDDPELPRNYRPIDVTDEDTFTAVSSIAKQIETDGRRPTRVVQSQQALESRTPEFWIAKRSELVLLCNKSLEPRRNGKPRRCSAILRLKVADSTIHRDQDVLECHNGHTRIWPPSDVRQILACDHPPFCAKCGRYEDVTIDYRKSRATCTVFECQRCKMRMQVFGNFLARPGKKNQPNSGPAKQSTLG